jgi:hypothetical protein
MNIYTHLKSGTLPIRFIDISSLLPLLIGSLTLWRETRGNVGWFLFGMGIVFVFLSGDVIPQPMSLWTFFVSMLAFASGYQLLTRGKIRF